MSYVSLIIVVVVMALGSGGYIWYLEKSAESIKNISPVVSPTTDTSAKTTDQTCDDFTDKFGATPQELVDFINSDLENTIILQGYLLIYLKITGLTPNAYLPMTLNLDIDGKIIDFNCQEPEKVRNYKDEIDITIPETDLAQIIRYRDTLEADQTATYLQNVITKPVEVKQIMLDRIKSLE